MRDRLKGLWFVLPLVLLIGGLACLAQESDRRWGELEFDGAVALHLFDLENGGVMKSPLRMEALPSYALSMVQQAMTFALEHDAARVISFDDMYHAHLSLTWDGETMPEMTAVESVLIHTQEHVQYEEESFRKRNVFIERNSAPRILPCPPHNTKYCTVGYSLPVAGVRMVDVTDIPRSLLAAYDHNIIVIAGRDVLVAYEEFTPDILAAWFEHQ